MEYCVAVLILTMESTTIHMMPMVILVAISSSVDSSLLTSTVGGGVAIAILVLVYLVGYHSVDPPVVQVALVLFIMHLAVARHMESLDSLDLSVTRH